MLRKWLLRLFPTLVLPAVLVLAACQPIQPVQPVQAPAEQTAPKYLPWDQLTTEQKIANGMWGGPAAITKEARIVEWPANFGDEMIVLREGSNGWTCFTDDAGFAYPTPLDDPACFSDAFWSFFEALMAGRDPDVTKPGVVYGYPGTIAIDNDDPYAATPPEGMGYDLQPPHIALLFPGGVDSNAYPNDSHIGMPYIMYNETPYAHLMVPIVIDSLTPVDPADRIANAMSAGPLEVAQDAAILDWPAAPDADWTVLREGTNGWTCIPDDNTLATATPPNDPLCLDATFMEWMMAYMAGRDPNITRPGVGYMLQGGANADNDDPSVWVPAAGGAWNIEPRHVMVVYPEPIGDAFPNDPNYGGPYVMFGDTPYEHLMIPVDPVVVPSAATVAHAASN